MLGIEDRRIITKVTYFTVSSMYSHTGVFVHIILCSYASVYINIFQFSNSSKQHTEIHDNS